MKEIKGLKVLKAKGAMYAVIQIDFQFFKGYIVTVFNFIII